MHHLWPVKQSVNSARGNLPFCESDDTDTDRWYTRTGSQTTKPTSNAEAASERDGDATGPTPGPCFEPPEHRNGDVARALPRPGRWMLVLRRLPGFEPGMRHGCPRLLQHCRRPRRGRARRTLHIRVTPA